MTVFDKITKLLADSGIKYELIEHAPVYTSEEAAKIRDTSMAIGAKALVLIGDKNPFLAVLPGDKRLNFKKIKNSLKIKDLRMATPEEVLNLTTLEIGSIPPVGRVMNLKSYYDDSFKTKDLVAFNAGSHTKSIKLQARGLLSVENPVILSLT